MEQEQDQEVEYEIRKLNLLAFPKNQHPKCELTDAPATVQLVSPYCTLYYLSEAHATQAWFGIIHKIAHLLTPLMAPPPIIGTHEEREKRANGIILSKRSLIEFCMSEASTLLSLQKYQLAIPAVIQALKFSKDVYGERSVEVVQPYLLLAQASLGMKRLKEAEEFLSLAKWNVLNSAECPDKTRSQLHQLIGRLNFAQCNFDASKLEFASSVFYSSRCYGAEAVATAPGYFRLGETFLAQNNIENALAFFDKVVDIWYKYLSAMHASSETAAVAASPGGGGSPGNNEENRVPRATVPTEQLSEDQLQDGRNQLEEVLSSRRRLLGENHIASGEVQYTLGLFEFFLLGNQKAADAFIVQAHMTYDQQLGSVHPSTRHVHAVLDFLRQQVRSDELFGATAGDTLIGSHSLRTPKK
eukprot:gene2009-3905_t